MQKTLCLFFFMISFSAHAMFHDWMITLANGIGHVVQSTNSFLEQFVNLEDEEQILSNNIYKEQELRKKDFEYKKKLMERYFVHWQVYQSRKKQETVMRIGTYEKDMKRELSKQEGFVFIRSNGSSYDSISDQTGKSLK